MPDQSKFIWFNGKIIPWDDARIHVMSHVLHYGSGVFEGIKCYSTDKGPAIFRLDDHIHRLFESGEKYRMKIPYNANDIIDATIETVRINGSVEIVSDQELKELEIALEVQNPDEKAKVLQGMLITIDEAYGHCPRAFTFADLWDKDQIDENSGTPKKLND